MPHQNKQHRTLMNDRKSPKEKKSGVLALQQCELHPSPSEAHNKRPPDFREVRIQLEGSSPSQGGLFLPILSPYLILEGSWKGTTTFRTLGMNLEKSFPPRAGVAEAGLLFPG